MVVNKSCLARLFILQSNRTFEAVVGGSATGRPLVNRY